MLQAGPVESVRRPKDQNGRAKSFGFIVFKHECSVPYAVELFKRTKLFNRNINVNTRNNHIFHVPVLDTHLTEFTGLEISDRDHRNNRNQRGNVHHRVKKDRDKDKASSWAELKNNALQGNRFESNYLQHDGVGSKGHPMENVIHPVLPDFNALLQMGQQMILPGIMGLQGIAGVPTLMGLGPSLGNSMFPSMQGRMSGGERHSPPRERRPRGHQDRDRRGYYEEREERDYDEERESRRDHHRGRDSRRDHPYDDRHRNRWEDHKHHDRGYSSSRSSHERERRDRRSR